MTRTIHFCIALIATFILVAQGRAQFVAYSQPSEEADGFCSSAIPGQYCSVRMADNFQLSHPLYRKVVEVTWWGSSDNYEYDDLSNFTHWVIVIYDDVDGLPGSPVYSAQIPKENIENTMTGEQNMDGGWEFMQAAALANPPTLFIDQPYWISIGYIAEDPGGDSWVWSRNYSQGDGECAIDHFDGQGYEPSVGDLAFELVADPAGGCPRAGESGRGCTADIDGSDDCRVTLADLAELLGAYGTCPGHPRYNPEADLTDDGNPCITIADLAELLGQYGDDCSY